MRRVLLLLLIALLPLRAWAGDVMALAAVPSPAVAAAVVAVLPPCHGDGAASMDHGNGAHTTAPLATGHAAHTDHPPHADDTSNHTSCSSCDICHGSVLSGPVICSGAHAPQTSRPTCAGAHFASAVLPGQHKPPIA